jgi:lysozyme
VQLSSLNIFLLTAWLFLSLLGCAPEEHPAKDYAVKGIDVSRHQKNIDWLLVAREDIDFVFAKATEGGDHRDSTFQKNWSALRRHRIRRGAYHFFRPEIAAEVQAANFIDELGDLLPGDLPPVLDVETRGKLSVEDFHYRLKHWLELVEMRYGKKPILYSGQIFYNRYLAGMYPDNPIWIARYHTDLPALADGRSFHFWQYADSGRVAGISGPVDVNIFTGNYLDLVNLSLPATELVGDPLSPTAFIRTTK